MRYAKAYPAKDASRTPIFVFMIGALAQIHIDFQGQLNLSELILLGIWAFGKRHLKIEPSNMQNYRIFVIFRNLLFCSLISQMITDIFLGVDYPKILKGTALIVFTIFNLTIIFKIACRYGNAIRYLLLGYAVSFFVSAIFQPNDYLENYPWKFGFAYGTTILLFLFLEKYLTRKKLISLLVLMAFVVLNFVLDARSLGVVIFFAGALYFFNSVREKSKILAIFSLVIVFVFVATGYNLYSLKASNGSLGVKVQEKYLSQTRTTSNILFGGRTNTFVGLSQVKKHPLVGQGSYARISEENRQEILTELVRINPSIYSNLFMYKVGDQIPIHSVLLQFWVWYGILGALPWIWFLCMLIYKLAKSIRKDEAISFVNTYLLTLVFWDLLFSPFGGDRRFSLPLFFISVFNSKYFVNSESKS